MNAEVRPFRRDDAPQLADLVRAVEPEFLVTAPLLVHWHDSTPARAHLAAWVAEHDGEIVGAADAELDWTAAEPGVGRSWVGVREDSRQQGIGAALYDCVERHLREHGARKLRAHIHPDPAGQRFAAKRGFQEARRERLSRLDVRTADIAELEALEAEKLQDGLRVVPLRELLDRRRDLQALYDEAHRDMPSDDTIAPLDFDEWERETMANPLLDPDLSPTVLDGERPVAFAWLLVDREGRRGEHELTGTLREYRGRGLARLAKLAAIRLCREHGIDTLLTGNDAANAPMLAVNDRLGYRPTVVRIEVVKEL